MNVLRFTALGLMALAIVSCGGNSKTEEANVETDAPETVEETMVEDPSDEEIFNLPEDARVFFVNMEDGATLTSPFSVLMGVEGMEIEPAGAKKVGYGHHHIFINRGFMETKEVIPMDNAEGQIPNDAVLTFHYGQGQEEALLDLAPGKYQLTLQFADGVHRSYGEQLSASINVEVQ